MSKRKTRAFKMARRITTLEKKNTRLNEELTSSYHSSTSAVPAAAEFEAVVATPSMFQQAQNWLKRVF